MLQKSKFSNKTFRFKWFCDIFEMAKKGKAELEEQKRHKWFERCKLVTSNGVSEISIFP